ncbi:MAG: tRNA (adenine(22)-N(1))-methyltransferase [Clostridia bacterium]
MPEKRMMILILTPRLKIIADSIQGFETVADIGSDHAYIPIYLVKNGRVKSAIATDINRGPVEISKRGLKSHKVEGLVSVRHGNGLEVISQGEAEVIVIAGMGGILIRDILDKDAKVAESAKLLILQPMRDSDKVRRWLLAHGFDIIDEELVKEQDKIYEVIWANPVVAVKMAEGPMLMGDRIIEKKHPLAAEYINKKVNELEKVVATLEGMDMVSCRERTEECRILLNYYLEVLQWVQ